MDIKIVNVDYSNSQQANHLVWILNEYAKIPEAGGKGLNDFAKKNVVKELQKLSGAFSLLAYIDNNPVGLTNIYTLFSTFVCKPVFYLSDVFVVPEYRRQGICQKLLNKVEEIANEKDVCRITLQVFEHNEKARKSYKKFGFVKSQLDPKLGSGLFLEKDLF